MRSFLKVFEPGLPVGVAGGKVPGCVRHHCCCSEAFPEELGALAKLCVSSRDPASRTSVSMATLQRESRSLKQLGRNITSFASGIQ